MSELGRRLAYDFATALGFPPAATLLDEVSLTEWLGWTDWVHEREQHDEPPATG